MRKTAQMCSWGTSSATRTTTSCSTASGSVMKRKTSMKCGHTSCSERRKASGTELSSRLMSGPDQGEQRPHDQARDDQEQRGHRAEHDQDHVGQQQAAPGQGPQHLRRRAGRLVALDRADQALEHAGVEGQPEGRGAEDERPR